MADPISFTPFLGWTDATDPNNIPADFHIISASDLLRYENFGKNATTAINKNSSDISTLNQSVSSLGNSLQETDTQANQTASDVATLTPTVAQHNTDITNLKKNRAVTTKTANYTVASTDSVIIANLATAITITLPSAVTMTAGRVFTVKNKGAGVATVASAAGTIDGAANKTLAQWAFASFISDGANWFII
ncbi:hypothetical protein PP641_gp034 [Arthrobacter phage SilentRX]|uniref:Uncharacterized protein n=1 Tax=Arthrobacter phage SilentRX TaxID=2836091 RepID=A0A8F3EBC7_9CAUD|nr:hypothetical protein PP641_gp034 [Arthrobacter phage SilentRX]QWY82774.1 hypothetical protein SEA_SILENTRX_34 [Arthrobacter phage SilentRX]